MDVTSASVSASAARLQIQGTQQSQEQQQLLRQQLNAQQNRTESISAEQRRAQETSANINDTRFQREQIRAIDDDNRFDALGVRTVEDARSLERVDIRNDDNDRVVQDRLISDALRNDVNPLPELEINSAGQFPDDQSIGDLNGNAQVFDQFLSDRADRLADRASDDARFQDSQARDFDRSVRQIESLSDDVGSVPTFEERGGIVDFSA